ncbi:MAG: hypothetical protein FJ109_04105 [Deltaproteobacteria bacterium]|nr:hypothetical protein [Deltaproteobacteria bacterium]
MKKLALVAGLLAALGFGCFGGEDLECVGDECNVEEPSLNLKDPGNTTEDPVVEEPTEEPVEEPAMSFPQMPASATFSSSGPDGQKFPPPAKVDEEGITIDDLTPEELKKVDTLRSSIELGLGLGKYRYIEQISLTLADKGIVADYEGTLANGFEDLEVEPEVCPFQKYYENGFQPTGPSCDYLVDVAKVEVYSELSKYIDAAPLPKEFQESEHFQEAEFWYEQGALSGVEEQRVMVRTDLKERQLCNKKPTPVESSHEKGVIVGRQLLAAKINGWLQANGHVADYPKMSKPIQVCNANSSVLLPAKQAAIQNIDVTAVEQELCKDYQPPTQEGVLQYSQAKIDYKKGIKEGIDAEFAMAAVIVFKVIPCNVSDPIVLDLDGDGIELVNIASGVNFDLYATGSKQAVAWVGKDDGFLVLDRNGNGVVDNGSELFGNLDEGFSDGFHHLAQLDRREFGGNQDGRIDSNDAAFAYLAVWQDADADGVCAVSEMIALSTLKITAVSLDSQKARLASGGNRIPAVSVVSGEREMLCGDAFLASAPYARLAGR